MPNVTKNPEKVACRHSNSCLQNQYFMKILSIFKTGNRTDTVIKKTCLKSDLIN